MYVCVFAVCLQTSEVFPRTVYVQRERQRDRVNYRDKKLYDLKFMKIIIAILKACFHFYLLSQSWFKMRYIYLNPPTEMQVFLERIRIILSGQVCSHIQGI